MRARKPNDIYRMRKSRKTVRFLLFYGDSRAAVRFGPHDLLLAPRQYSMRLPGDFRVFTRTYGNRLGRNRAGLARTHVFSSVPRDASVSINSEDIFHSSAGYYTEFRKPYPQRIFDLVRDKFQPDGQVVPARGGRRPVRRNGRLCTPERHRPKDQKRRFSCFVRGRHFIGGGRVQTRLLRQRTPLDGHPETLAAGNSLLAPGGGVAVLGMRSIWGGGSDWEQTVIQVVRRWMGQDRRAGTGTFDMSIQENIRFEDALSDAGFDVFDSGAIEARYTVDVEFILGHLYTTSYCNRDLLGDRVEEFEEDMAQELQHLSVSGTYPWSPGVSYIFARKRV